jgi:ribosome-associated protein YbcJ (S4-like RNA binding protein)
MITTGGQVKPFLLEQKIVVNGDQENRRGRKLYPGDTIQEDGIEKYQVFRVGSQKHCFIQSRNASGFFAVCYQARVIGQCQELGNISDRMNIHPLVLSTLVVK